MAVIHDLKWQLKKEWDKEEIFWKQKSRVTWLNNGDKNTKFFHASVMQRRACNRISGIEVDNGNWTSDPQEVKAEFHRFFSGIFTVGPNLQMHDTVEVIPHKITAAMNHTLV